MNLVINSTYQPDDSKDSLEDETPYGNDASISAKLDKSEPHTNTLNNSVNKTDVNHPRYNKSISESSQRGSGGGGGSSRSKSSDGDGVGNLSVSDRQALGETISNKIIEGYKANGGALNVNIDEDGDEIDYYDNSVSASESIVIKLGRKTPLVKSKPNKKYIAGDNVGRIASKESGSSSSLTLTTAPATTTTATAAAVVTSSIVDNNFNDDYYSKDDMSVYDDVNNNRLNLRNVNGHFSAYHPEQPQSSPPNEGIPTTAADNVKSYIHIEVFKGNLDELTTAPTESTPKTSTLTTTSFTKASASNTTPDIVARDNANGP